MATDFRGKPGVYAGPSLNSRNIYASFQLQQVQTVPSFLFIDGNLTRDTGSSTTSALRAGLMLGKVTTGGKLRNTVIGLTSGAVAAGTVTSVPVPAVVASEVARLIAVAGGNVNLKLIGPPTAAGTVSVQAITATAAGGTSITISSTTLAAAVVGSAITPADGSEKAVTVLTGPYPTKVVDTSGVNIDQPLHTYLRGADLKAAMIVNLTEADASVQAYFKAQLKAAGVYTFDNDR